MAFNEKLQEFRKKLKAYHDAMDALAFARQAVEKHVRTAMEVIKSYGGSVPADDSFSIKDFEESPDGSTVTVTYDEWVFGEYYEDAVSLPISLVENPTDEAAKAWVETCKQEKERQKQQERERYEKAQVEKARAILRQFNAE